jgi:hypothetical protein
MLTTTMTASLVGLALARPASAATVTPPSEWGNANVSAVVGSSQVHGQVVCFRASGQQPVAYILGNASGLNNNWLVATNGGNDTVTVVSSTALITDCGLTLFPLVYGVNPRTRKSWRLDVSTRGGNDFIDCGSGASDCDGAQGNDRLFSVSSVGKISGGSGKDTLTGQAGQTALDRLSGGSDRDCLRDDGNRHALFDCGSGNNDLYVGNVPDQINCEEQVATCPNPIP